MGNEDGFAIVPRGSGTGLSGGAIPAENSVTLLFNHWDKILEVDSDNLTAWDPNNILIPGKIISHEPKCEGKLHK